MLNLTGKTAIVTGASSGIGMATARLFARQGANVVLVARRAQALETLAEEIRSAGGSALAVAGDVTEPGFAETVCAQAVATYGQLDILVNNAGIGDKHKSTLNTTDEWWHTVVSINQDAVFRFCRAALGYMTQRASGAIVNISSIGGVYSIAGVAYSAAKAAVLGLTKNIAVQYAGTGIRCNAVCPGPTETPMLAPDPDLDVEMMEITGRRVDGTTGISAPEDMANAILFLVSDEARCINGQYLTVDKGSCI